MKKIIAIALLGLAGCGGKMYGQIPPVSVNITYTWQAPSAPPSGSTWPGCTAQYPCAYVLSILTVAQSTQTCPAPSSSSVYSPVNQSSPTSNLTYVYQNPVLGDAYCAIVQTVQPSWTQQPSDPSPPSNVVLVNGKPGSPGQATGK